MALFGPIIPEFFKPYTLWTLHLPVGIVEALARISFGKGKVGEKRMDRMMVRLSQMISTHEAYKKRHGHELLCMPIGVKKWIAMSGEKISYQQMEHLAVSSGVLERVLNHKGVHSFKINGFARGYRVCKSLRQGKKIEVRLNHPTQIIPEPSEQQLWLAESYKYVEIADFWDVYEESWNQIGKVTKRNQTIIPEWVHSLLEGEYKTQYTSIQTHLDSYTPIMMDGFSEPRYQFNGRMKDSICGLPAWIRDNMMTIDGEQTAKCDFKALHHNIWWVLFRDAMKADKPVTFPQAELDWWEENVNGDGHTKLARAILRDEGIPDPSPELLASMRKEVKLESLSHYNTTLYMMQWKEQGLVLGRMSALLATYVPNLYLFIRNTKTGPYGHCNTSILLTRKEGALIQASILGLKQAGIHCGYVHDCLMIAKSNSDAARSIMNRVATDMGIPTYVDH